MRLSGVDETELLLPLYSGVHDAAQWQIFLRRVQRRTQADAATLIFAPAEGPVHQSKQVCSGRNLREEARALHADLERLPHAQLRPGRVYHMSEFTSVDAQFRAFYDGLANELQISDECLIRIKEQEGTAAWLTLSRGRGLFSASTSALLAALAPHVAVALGGFVIAERQRLIVAASSDALSRAGVGWVALNRDARIVDLDSKLAPLLSRSGDPAALLGERLPADSFSAREMLAQAALTFATHPDAGPRALLLRQEPRLEALLVPMPDDFGTTIAGPVMLAFCRTGHATTGDPQPVLRALFGLSAREAELAQAISDGRSINEAAAAMGLTNETARGYSKTVYAKMGVRGQAELVRRIFMSSAALA